MTGVGSMLAAILDTPGVVSDREHAGDEFRRLA